MQAVIDHNKSVAARATQFNIRVGENRFPVMDSAARTTWLAGRLQGARCVSEVRDWNALRLPELDTALVERTLAECPDSINVLGADVSVEYRAPYYGTNYAPRVSLPEELVANNGWLNLPDEGVILPGGRVVEVSFRIGGSYYGTTFADTNIPQLKGKVKDHLNQKQWENAGSNLPAIPVMDPADEGWKIPEISTHQYGTCEVDGTPLMCYGTVAVNPNRYYSNDPWFKATYYRDMAEAQKARTSAVEKLSQVREEAKLQAQRGQLLCEVETLKTKATELYGLAYNQYYGEFPSDLRIQVSTLRSPYFYSSTSAVDIKRWIDEATPILDKAQAEIDRITVQRAEAERVRLETEEIEKREFAVILPLVDDRMKVARDIFAFAKAVESINGAVKGARLLRKELSASYGRAGRQQALREAMPTLEEYDNASGVLYFNRAADVDLWLEVAATWLESRNGGGVAVQKKSAPQPSSMNTVSMSSSSGGFTLADLAGKFGGASRR